MKLYGISGIGADERVYKGLFIDSDFVFIDWIKPNKDESLKSYSARLSSVVDVSEDFGLIGVSFGGIVAVEIAKKLDPKLVILISSIELSSELKPLYRYFGRTKLNSLLPTSFYNLPRGLARFLFGTKSLLLDQILDDTDLSFTKWAVNQLLSWENKSKIDNLYRIHGTKDKLLGCPKPGIRNFLIENGGHFTIVDEAVEVSDLINKIVLLSY